jgi:hypothetical protein
MHWSLCFFDTLVDVESAQLGSAALALANSVVLAVGNDADEVCRSAPVRLRTFTVKRGDCEERACVGFHVHVTQRGRSHHLLRNIVCLFERIC